MVVNNVLQKLTPSWLTININISAVLIKMKKKRLLEKLEIRF